MSGARIARIAVFAAFVAVLGITPAISVPGITVPITAQTLGVMLAGLMLAPIEAFLSMSLFLGLVASGLPLLSGGRGGIAVFTGPSAGFLLGWPVAAATIAVIAIVATRMGFTQRHRGQVISGFTASVVGGVVVLYAIGIPVGAFVAGLSVGEFFTASLAFVPGDLLKAAAATAVAASAFRAAPFLRPGLAASRN